MPSELRLNSEVRRVRRLARERRTSIEAVKIQEAKILACVAASPWIGVRIEPALPLDHPSLAQVEEPRL